MTNSHTKPLSKSSSYLLLLLSLTFIIGCATAGRKIPRPNWVGAQIQGDYTEDGIEGIGFGTYKRSDQQSMKVARDTAYNDALQKMTLRLKTTVKGSVKTYLIDRKDFVSGKEESTEVLESVTESIFDNVLGRKHFEEFREDRKGEWWVLVWMTREEADKAIREALAEQERANQAKLSSAQNIYKSAYKALLSGELSPAFKQFDQAKEILSSIVGITQSLDGMSSSELSSEIDRQTNQAISSIKMDPVGGNQTGIQGKALAEPLGIFVHYTVDGKDVPARNLPLVFYFVDGGGEIDKTSRTNDKGRAIMNVYRVDTINPANAVEAKFDAQEIEKVSERFKPLAKRRATITFASISPKETKKVVVSISESQLGHARQESIVENEIISYLTESGYQIMGAEQLGLAHGNITLASIRGKAHILISGTATTESVGGKISLPDGTSMDMGPSCRASVWVSVTDVETGKVISSKTENRMKGFGRTEEEASAQALKKAAGVIAQYLSTQIIR